MNEQDLRDVFAMFALNGIIVHDGALNDNIATRAYNIADMMLEARKPKETIGLPAIKRKTKVKDVS